MAEQVKNLPNVCFDGFYHVYHTYGSEMVLDNSLLEDRSALMW
jgi:hypothetical protein